MNTQNDNNKTSTKLLVAVAALQVLTLASQWTGHTVTPAVAADIPDPGARQMAMVDELKQLNAKLDRLVGVMEGGKLQVTVTNMDNANQPAKKK